LGGITFDEWLAEDDYSGGRHAIIDNKEIEVFEMLRRNHVSEWT